MFFSFLADAVLLLHLAFIVFVLSGALLVCKFPRLAWLHLPAVAWGAGIEISGAVCPLTPLENRLRWLAGEAGYPGSFVANYLLPVIYPHELSREFQAVLGVSVVVLNILAYAWLYHRKKKHGR